MSNAIQRRDERHWMWSVISYQSLKSRVGEFAAWLRNGPAEFARGFDSARQCAPQTMRDPEADRPQVRTPDGFVLRRTGGYNISEITFIRSNVFGF